jgi:hypothetical protein
MVGPSWSRFAKDEGIPAEAKPRRGFGRVRRRGKADPNGHNRSGVIAKGDRGRDDAGFQALLADPRNSAPL